MEDIKNVYDPKTKQVIQVDANVEKDWMTKYRHRSGVPFKTPKKEFSYDDLSNEKLCELVAEKTGKPVAAAYKNRKEWLLWKLS